MRAAVILLIFTFLSSPLTGSAETILNAFPSTKVTSTDKFTTRSELNRQQQIANRVIIEKIDDKYYWTTRQNHELFPTKSGLYMIFIDPMGSGYVKVNVNSGEFIEHVHLGLQTITYWGSINDE